MNKPKKQADKQADKLAWVLREWDCLTVEEAKAKAGTDAALHLALRECGIRFEPTRCE